MRPGRATRECRAVAAGVEWRVKPVRVLTGELWSRREPARPASEELLPGELDRARALGGAPDHGAARVVAAEQFHGGLRVPGRDDHAESAAHVEDLVELGVLDRAALSDEVEHERHR